MWNNSQEEQEEEEWKSVQTAIMERLKFFAPSTDLAKDLLLLNDEIGSAYFDREYENLSADEGNIPDSEEEPVKDNYWFKWLLQQVSEIFDHREQETNERHEQTEEEVISFFQTFISERVFNHMAMLSRSRHAKQGKSFSIREELTKEIAEKLGLGLYLHQKTSPELRARAEEVLLRLAREFQHWIDERDGMFTTTWGTICTSGMEIIPESSNTNFVILIPDVETDEVLAATEDEALAATE